VIPGQFEYHRPTKVDEAISLLAQYGEDSRLLAGGHSLIPMMKLRMAVPDHIIDLQAIEELAGISEDGGDIVIGVMTTQKELLESNVLTDKIPILRETALLIADPQVRYCGTIGGNVANGDPGNDLPAVMKALDARFSVKGPDGTREIAARDYYEAAYFTALVEGEMLTAVRIPTPPAGHGYAYEKQKRKVGDYATAAAAVVLTVSGGTCGSASIALTNVASTALYAEEASDSLVGKTLDEAAISKAASLAAGIAEPASDGRGPADFRTKVAEVMVKRALAQAASRAA